MLSNAANTIVAIHFLTVRPLCFTCLEQPLNHNRFFSLLHVSIMSRTFLSLKVYLIALRSKRNKMTFLFNIRLPECIFEYETPKVVTVKNKPWGIFRLVVQTSILTFIFGFQLWYSRGYQAFSDLESSLTNKLKGRST